MKAKSFLAMVLSAGLVLSNFQGWEFLKNIEMFKKIDVFQGIEKSFAASYTYGDFGYHLNSSKTISIDAYNGTDKEIVIPSEINGTKVTNIAEYTFMDCDKITNIQLPDTIRYIGDAAFVRCTSLKNITLPKSLTGMGVDIFGSCTSLESINVDGENSIYTSVDGVLYSKDLATLVYVPGIKLTYTIPNNVTTIGEWAFTACDNLKSVEIPTSVTSMDDGCFAGCDFESITIPDSVTSMGYGIFIGCKSLKSVKIPEGISKILYGTFMGCSNLKNVELPKSLKEINSRAFQECISLTSLDIPEGVERIEYHVFQDCTSLIYIEIPKSVTTIGGEDLIEEEVFTNCNEDLTIYGEEGSCAELYAKQHNIKFVDISQNIYVTFDPDNGSEIIKQKVKKDESLSYIPEAPAKQGYVFVGWFEDINDITTKYTTDSKYTENITYKAKYAHIEMLGAQAKTVVNGKGGIRFGTKVYDDGDKIVEKGTLILPANFLQDDETLTLDTPKIIKSVGKVLYEENKEENYFIYLGTLVNIPESQFSRKITASSYVIYQDESGNRYTVYAPYDKGSISVNDLLNMYV